MLYKKMIYLLFIIAVSFLTCTSTDDVKDEESEVIVSDASSDLTVVEDSKDKEEVDKKLPMKELKKRIREAEGYYIKATKAAKNGDKEKAEELYLKALELYPAYISALGNLALLYREQGDYEKAIYYYKQAVELDSEDLLSRQNLAAIYMLQNEYEAASKLYAEMISISKESPEGHYGLGRVELYQKRYTTAIEHLLQAEKLYNKRGDKNIHDARYLLGFTFYRLDDYKNALDYFTMAYTTFAEYPELNYYIGISLLSQEGKDVEAARIYLLKAKELGFELPAKIAKFIKQ